MIRNNTRASFASEYNYLRLAAKGSVGSTTDQYGATSLNSTVSIPSQVKLRPPYIEYYLEYPTGTFRPVGGPGDVQVGNNNNTMYFNGYYNGNPFNASFRCHYVIYERRSM